MATPRLTTRCPTGAATALLACSIALGAAAGGCGTAGLDVARPERDAGSGSARDAGKSSAGKPSAPVFDAGSDPDRNEVVAGELCDRLAVIQCAAEGACCKRPGRDFATCVDALAGACSGELLFDDIAAEPSAGFDAERARAMLDEFERRASQCDPSIASFGESQAGLRSMFRGTIEPGASCRPSNLLNQAMIGAALSACTMPEDQACLPSETSWQCSARSGAGGACFTDVNCKPGYSCPNTGLGLSGASCVARKADGEACAAESDCKSLYCVGARCVPADQQLAYCPQ